MQKILVVDDEKDMCHMISSILQGEGYRVDKAYNCRQAIQRIKATRYNLMILDYKLPNSTGINLLKEVRLIQPSLKVIMLSAYGSPSIKSMAKKFCVYRFIDKPFDLNKLVRVVRGALSKKVRARLTAPLKKRNL